MRVPLANLRVSYNEGDGEAVMEAGDDGPIAGVSIDLDGAWPSLRARDALAIDELALRPGDRVFALVKSVVLDERAVAAVEARPFGNLPAWKPDALIDSTLGGGVFQQRAEMRACPNRGLSPVLQPQLPQNGLHMHLHRRLGDHQLARDDLVRRAFGERAQNHQLTEIGRAHV